jgi:hypothetical protein
MEQLILSNRTWHQGGEKLKQGFEAHPVSFGVIPSTSLFHIIDSYPGGHLSYNGHTWKYGLADVKELRHSATTSVTASSLYLMGGIRVNDSKPVATCDVYDAITNTWTPLLPLSVARASASSVIYNGMVYVMGGYNSTTGYLSSFECWCIADSQWMDGMEAWQLPTPLSHFVSVIIDTCYLYICGGWQPKKTRDCWYTDLSIARPHQPLIWSRAPSLPEPISDMTAVVL